MVSLATAMSYLFVVWGMLTGYFIFNEVHSTVQCNNWIPMLARLLMLAETTKYHAIPNKLSLGGALLVCSCTMVLGLAGHMFAIKVLRGSQKGLREMHAVWKCSLAFGKHVCGTLWRTKGSATMSCIVEAGRNWYVSTLV